MNKKELLFLQIANHIEHQIKNDVLKVSDKLPSLRTIAFEKGVSVTTVQQAYFELERRGLIEARSKSGYYVIRQLKHFKETPSGSNPVQVKSNSELAEAYSAIYLENGLKGVNLVSTQLSPEFLPVSRLRKEIISASRSLPYAGILYDRFGNERLKKQIALRSLRWGGKLKSDEVLPTPGCLDAIALALTALLKPGDTIGVESPLHYGFINITKNLGYKILELPTHPTTGIDVEFLEKTLKQNKIDLLLLMANFSNPFGSHMPDENKREVVRLIQKYDIPMIEDDIYSDLYFENTPPKFCKTFDESGSVIWCGSVSKTLAGGYRVGWMAPGKYKSQILKAKPHQSINCNSITHEAIANFFENNRYDNYLKKVRQTLYSNSLNFLHTINEHFPLDTKVTRPQGGIQLWVELNKRTDTTELYNNAFAHKINIAPGRIFTNQNQFNNCLRLSYGMQWNAQIENALKLLGKLASR